MRNIINRHSKNSIVYIPSVFSYISVISLLLYYLLCNDCNAQEKRLTSDAFYQLISQSNNVDQLAFEVWSEWNHHDQSIGLEIANFQNKYYPFILALSSEETWAKLKKKLGKNMVKQGLIDGISWQEFREIDKKFKEKLVNKVLTNMQLQPVQWLVTGTVGYDSDIDNVAIGNSSNDLTAKLLFDLLNIYIYRAPSAITFDEECYTELPQTIFHAFDKLEMTANKNKYGKLAFTLGQVQMYRQLHKSKLLTWHEYTKNILSSKEARKLFTPLLSQVEYFEDKLHTKIEAYTRAFRETNASFPEEKALVLINAKILVDMQRNILHYNDLLLELNKRIELKQSVMDHKTDVQQDILSDINRRDEVLILLSALYGMQATFYPESYYTQEAFLHIVKGPSEISQIFNLKLKEAANQCAKNKRECVLSLRQLKEEVRKTYPESMLETQPIEHLVSMSEQLAYFLHKLHEPTIDDLLNGSKYLKRFAHSISELVEKTTATTAYHYTTPLPESMSIDKVRKLDYIASNLERFKRGVIPTNRLYIQNALSGILQKFRDSKADQASEILDKTIEHIVNHIDYKIMQQVLSQEQKILAIQAAFDHTNAKTAGVKIMLDRIRHELNIQNTAQGIVSDNIKLNAMIDSILGKDKINSDAISQNLPNDLRDFAKQMDIETKREVRQLVAHVVKLYTDALHYYLDTHANERQQKDNSSDITIDRIVNLDSIHL